MTMKQKANASLLLLALLFTGAAVCLYVYPGQWWAKMLLYTAEAGLVGALADLFAVTALFRSPMGMRWIPHTGIIPRNRDKLVDGVVQMVEEQLLSKELLRERLSRFRLVETLIHWVDHKKGLQAVAAQVWKLALSFLRRMDAKDWSEQLDGHARKALAGVNLAPYSGAALKWVLNHSDVQKWLGHIVDYAAEKTAGDEIRQAIADMLAAEKNKFVSEGGSFTRWLKQKLVDFAEAADAINLEEAAETLHRDLQSFMESLKNPQHELRIMLVERLHELADHLENSDDAAKTIDEWKRDVLLHLSFQPAIQGLLEAVAGMLAPGSDMKYIVADNRTLQPEDIQQWMTGLFSSYWESFKADKDIQEQLEGYAGQFLAQTIESEHAVIGVIVRRTLDDFTEERLVHFIEEKVDTDLQRIRLNGALIGSAVGALLFLFLHGVYQPLLDLL